MLRDLVKRGESWSGMDYAFKKNGSVPAYVHVLWDWNQKDIGCLVTSDNALSPALMPCVTGKNNLFVTSNRVGSIGSAHRFLNPVTPNVSYWC